MVFPATIDNNTDPISTDPLNLPDHATLHTNKDATLVGLQNKLGIDSSAVTTSIDFMLRQTSGHTVLNADGNNFVKIKVLKQEDTTNVYKANTALLHGWGYVNAGGATTSVAENVTYGITYSELSTPFLSYVGNGAANTTLGLYFKSPKTFAEPDALGTTGFRATLETGDATNMLAGNHFYTWFTIGQLN